MSPKASHRVRPGLSSAASLMTTLLISFDQEVLNQQLTLVTPEYPFFESPCVRRRGACQGRNADGLVPRTRGERGGAEKVPEHREAGTVCNRLHIVTRHIRAAGVVEDNEFERTATDTTCGIDLVDIDLGCRQALSPN